MCIGEQGRPKATLWEGENVSAMCMPRATREDAGRTEPGAPLPQGQKREKVAAIGNFKCSNWQRGGTPLGWLQPLPLPRATRVLCQDAIPQRTPRGAHAPV